MLFVFWILCLILLQPSRIQAFNDLKSITHVPLIKGDTRQIFNYEQTIVVRDLLPNNQVHRCEMIETG